ncbi:MAG: hypothetical protein H5T85_03245 [Actinobacteria bacterium]|nr:hypothetical protein [Actinomycetota bacterium]
MFEIVPQDIEWVKKAKATITNLYEHRDLDHIPFEFTWSDPLTLDQELKTLGRPKDEYRRFIDDEYDLKTQLKNISDRVKAGCWDDTVLSLWPYQGVYVIAEAFGCQTIYHDNREPSAKPVIDNIRQVDKLKPNLNNSNSFKRVMTKIKYFQSVVKDKIPVSMTDLQSPIDIASQIVNYSELIYAMKDDPKRVHNLLRMITEILIESIYEMKKVLLTDWPASLFRWLPRGIFLSDDLLAVLSPELYNEFAVPYNEILAKEFNGLVLHSCGVYLHNIPVLLKTKGLLGINFHEFTVNDISRLVNDEIVLAIVGYFYDPYNNYSVRYKLSRDELISRWKKDYVRVVDFFPKHRILWWVNCLEPNKKEKVYENVLNISYSCRYKADRGLA